MSQMRYVSTRGDSATVDFSTALVEGLAPDGGLYVPELVPELADGWRTWSYRQAMSGILEIYGCDDTTVIVDEAASRFAHPEVAPIVEVGDRSVLELFWGPTLSFKDHALQVVGRLLSRSVDGGVVLGATSGDTGSAAIEGLRGSEKLRVVILFPEGRVSDFQRRQMTTVPDANVTAVAVRGTFDDCQRMVKEAFSRHSHLLAVNSINWARVAAQIGFHVHASARLAEPHDVIVPTGNFGNVYSVWLAKQMGASIGTITIANNANHSLADMITGGGVTASEVVPTLAPAMDIRSPSNLERFTGDLQTEFRATWSDDSQIRETIATVKDMHGYVIDPHTATAWRAADETRTGRLQLVVSTAHPAKFDSAVPAPDWFGELPTDERVVTIDPLDSELEDLIR